MNCTWIDAKQQLRGKQDTSTKFVDFWRPWYVSYVTLNNSSQPTVQWEMEPQQPRTVQMSPRTPSHEPANEE
jgi:hypothetical protein